MNYKLIVSLLALSALPILHTFQVKTKIVQTSATQSRVEIECQLAPDEMLFHDSLQFSCNIPSVKITKWFALKDPHTYFDPRSKKSEPIYSDSVIFTLIIDSLQEIPSQALIHMYYQTNLVKNPQEKFFSIGVPQSNAEPQQTQEIKKELILPKAPLKIYQKSSFTQMVTNITTQVTSLIKDKELPLVVKFLLAFIIGLIMSLTPCIYPMIPITMGILQANKAHTLFRGFSLASAYTAGLSTTFALLGMIAAYGGAQFGSAMGSPWVIVPIVLFFAYLGFSMLGFYEMYIPRFMQPRHGHKNNGSLLSAFTFGIINGTVASPCLSPGLALILGIVSGLANPILGFLLLFAFGVGSSFPLLIIGTFSSSLHILPRAGMWMIEFKKIFGFLLLGMCLYYLKTFMPEWTYYIALGLYIVIIASYYLHYGFKYNSWFAKITGLTLCLSAAFMLTESYRTLWRTPAVVNYTQKMAWYNGYDATRSQAISENKLVLLDFTAEWCTLCKKLEREFFSEKLICQEIPKRVIPLKIDCTDNTGVECVGARKKFGILGYPAIILIDPKNETILQRWDSDLNYKDPQEFINELDTFIKM
ncbi:MAG: thioredoxin family protein [Candidatus Babeliaceae bacterium]|nr:thioredoxin family protein [Candidatus Babeliaceae bacterium]